jgi:hypothetical protein
MDDRLIFTVGSAAFRWSDVVFAARRWGTWDELERRTAEGIACLRAAAAVGKVGRSPVISERELEGAADEFRYRRDLLAGDELSAWLEARGLGLDDWREHIARSVAREHFAANLDELGVGLRPSPEKIASKIDAEGLCSGAFAKMAERLSGIAACRDQLRSEGRDVGTEAGPPLDDRSLDGLELAHRRLMEDVATRQAIEREVAARTLDWIRISAVSGEFPDEDTAREAAMCVRHDGQDLAAAAARAGVDAWPWTVFMEDAADTWRPALVGARVGDLVGPIRDSGGFALLLVTAKVLPEPADPEVHERATANLLTRAVDRAVNDRVVWHAAL